jgi:hypothetical protein
MALPCPTGTAIFSSTKLQHGLTIGFLKSFDLSFVLLPNTFRLGAKGILYSSLAVFDPVLNLRRGEIVLSGSYRNSCLVVNNLKKRALFPGQSSA